MTDRECGPVTTEDGTYYAAQRMSGEYAGTWFFSTMPDGGGAYVLSFTDAYKRLVAQARRTYGEKRN